MRTGCDNLKGELAKRGISRAKLATNLGIHPNTLSNKLEGKSYFTIAEAFAIKDAFFPDTELRYLFAQSDETKTA